MRLDVLVAILMLAALSIAFPLIANFMGAARVLRSTDLDEGASHESTHTPTAGI